MNYACWCDLYNTHTEQLTVSKSHTSTDNLAESSHLATYKNTARDSPILNKEAAWFANTLLNWLAIATHVEFIFTHLC